jgi:DNA polymerase III epsilon subunit-like protein
MVELHKMIFLDTETSSLNVEEGGVLQISGIIDIYESSKLLKTDSFNIEMGLFADDVVDPVALEKNGIQQSGLHLRTPPRKAFNELKKKLLHHVDQFDKSDKFIALAYAAPFDNSVLRNFWKKNHDEYFGSLFWTPWVDIMSVAMHVLQDQRKGMENFKLATVAQHIGVDIHDEWLHNATYDVHIAREVYYELTGRPIYADPYCVRM